MSLIINLVVLFQIQFEKRYNRGIELIAYKILINRGNMFKIAIFGVIIVLIVLLKENITVEQGVHTTISENTGIQAQGFADKINQKALSMQKEADEELKKFKVN